MVSENLINELGLIIREDYGIELRQEVVAEIGNTFVSFIESLVRIEHQVQAIGGKNA